MIINSSFSTQIYKHGERRLYMKKRAVAIVLSMMVAAGAVACANQTSETATEEVNVAKKAESDTQVDVQNDEVTKQLTDEEKAQVLADYTKSLEKLGDKTFDMNVGYKVNDGLYGKIDGPIGALYWQYALNTDNLVVAKYDGTKNALSFESVTVDENGETKILSDVVLSDYLRLSDEMKVLFSSLETASGQNLIMVEYRDLAYTYADGVTYNITLIQIGDDGSLIKVFDDGICGSGDEDITATLRAGFNKAVNKDYAKDTFEDAFYNGNLLIEQENMPVYATIQFKSESGKLADDGDWEGASGIASKLYENMDSDVAPFYWGKGKFVVDESYK